MACMANIQVSVWISEELVGAADDVAEFEKRSRNYVLSRWLRDGAKSAGVEDVGEEAQETEKKSDIPGRGKNPKRVGRIPEEMVDSPVVAFDGVAGQRLVRVEDVNGRVWTREEVEAAGFGELQPPVVDGGLPEPGFVPAGDNSDFPGMDVAAGLVPRSGFEAEGHNTDFPGDYGGIPRNGALAAAVAVPKEAVAFAKHLRDKVEAFTGADPQILNQTEKPHARTLQSVETAEAHRNSKSKKIASVPASAVPTPGKSQEKKNVQTQSRQPQAGQSRREDPTPQTQSPQAESESQPPAGTGQRLDGHDPKTCKLYGCLMCKSAKEEK